MEILRLSFIWIFGILSVLFFVISITSLFLNGSTFFRVSDKANEKHHLYMLAAAISSTLWFISYSPEKILEGVFCLLPIAFLYVGFSYFMAKSTRNALDWFSSKTGFEYPFKKKK